MSLSFLAELILKDSCHGIKKTGILNPPSISIYIIENVKCMAQGTVYDYSRLFKIEV